MASVYWCARDLATRASPFGNHHFILIVLDKGETLHPFIVQEENGVRFVTLATFNIRGQLKFEESNEFDVLAVREWLNADKYRRWWAADFDLERHEVKPPKGTGKDLADLLAKLALQFEAKQKASPQDYGLVTTNCAAWCNSILAQAGVPAEQRAALSDFTGIDAGESVDLPASVW